MNSIILEGRTYSRRNKKFLDVALSTSFSLKRLSYLDRTFRRAAWAAGARNFGFLALASQNKKTAAPRWAGEVEGDVSCVSY